MRGMLSWRPSPTGCSPARNDQRAACSAKEHVAPCLQASGASEHAQPDVTDRLRRMSELCFTSAEEVFMRLHWSMPA
jgi:hypothetical protein